MAIPASPKPLVERQLRLVFDADQPMARITTNVIPIRPNVVISSNHPAIAARIRYEKQPVQLTVRGRRVVAILVLIPIVLAMVLFGSKVAQANSVAPAMTTVVVKPGQSLWDIAVAVDATKDPRALILEIQQLNGLSTSQVDAGMQLIVPAS